MSTPSNFGLDQSQRSAYSVSRFEKLADYLKQNMRVAVPAVVQSFNADAGTVTCTVAINEDVQLNANGSAAPLNLQTTNLTVGGSQLGQGLLVDIPVCMPTGGGWSLTFPIKRGDECLLVFNDLEIDNWFTKGGTNSSAMSSRRHDLSDAVAIFGLRSTPRLLKNYSTSSSQLRSNDGTVVIDLAPTQITITAPSVVVNASGDAIVNGNNISVTARDTVSISGNTINMTAANQILLSGTSLVFNGINWGLHFHPGVATGTSITGLPED